MERKQLIKNYFNVYDAENPSFKNLKAQIGIGSTAFGFFLLLMQFLTYFQDVIVFSTVFILIGLFFFWLWIKPFFINKKAFADRPLDEDMDDWFLEDVNSFVKPKALNQLRINPSSVKPENIILIPYPVYWSAPGIPPDDTLRREGDDGLFLYSIWNIQVLVVTNSFISFYSCYFDWLNDKITGVRTNEFFFEDISSIKNDIFNIENKLINDAEQSGGSAKTFKLTNMSGDSLEVITEVPKLMAPPSTKTNLDSLIQALRIVLRNRRAGEYYEEKVEEKKQEHNQEEIDNKTEETTSKKPKYFHQELKEIHNNYSKQLEEERKKGKDIRS